MKKSIIMMVLTVLALVSCRREPLDPGSNYAAEPALEIVSKDVIFQAPGGVGSIVVKSTGKDLLASSQNPWLTISVSGNQVTLVAEENMDIESRYSVVTLVSGEQAATVVAQQFGITSELIWDDEYVFPSAGGDVTLKHNKEGYVQVDVDEKWISAEVDDEAKTLAITVAKNLYNVEREGTVTFTSGEDVRVIRIRQEANPSGINPGDPEPQEFVVEKAWTPKYYLDESDASDDVVGVEVNGTDAGSYFIKVIPAAEFQAAGGDQYTYLNKNAFQWSKESPKTYTDSAKEKVGKLAVGSYLVYAIGVKPSAELSYTYAVATFNVTKTMSPYERFLGTWSVSRGDQEDTWTITEKVPNQTYTISGIESLQQDFPIEAIFNESDNSMTLKGQGPIGQYTFTNSGTSHTVDMYFGGLVDRSGSNVFVRGSYNVAKAVISEAGKMTVSSAGEVKLSDGNTYQIIAMEYYGKEDNSGWTFNRSTPSTFPFTAIQTSQGEGSGGNGGGGNGGDGGNGGGGGSTSGYEAWIGSWTLAGKTVKISQKVAGSTYTVSGIEEGYDIVTRYADGNMEFFFQDIAQDAAGRTVSLYGIDDDGDGYIVEGDPANDGWLATATLNAAGTSATVEGARFTATYSGQTYNEHVVIMEILAYDDAEGKFYYASSDPTSINMPTTMSKAGTSSLSLVTSSPGVDLATGVQYEVFRPIGGKQVLWKKK